MLKKMCSVILCLAMVTVALMAVPCSVSANGHIEATVELKPETLNLASHGVFTAFITLPEGYDVADIDASTVQCEGASAVRGMIAGNTFIAKFNREDLVDVSAGDEVTLTVTGTLIDGTHRFEGSDTIRVVNED